MWQAITGNRWVRWLAPLALLVVLGVAFRDQLPFLGEGFARLRDTHRGPLALGVVTAVLAIVAMAEVMRLLLGAGGTSVRFRDSTALTLAHNAWSTTLPGGPAFSAVFTYRVQRSWGASALLCGWFLVLSSAVSTMWLVLIGVAGVFFLGAQVNVWSLVLTLAAMTALSWGVYWAADHPAVLERWARRVLPRFNRLLRRPAGQGLEGAVEHIRRLETVRLTRGRFALVAGQSLANRLFDVATLYACVWAVTGVAPGITAGPDHTTVMGVLLAYTTAKLAGSAQVTPGGLGTVEAAVIATLVASGMTAVDATGAAIIYRLVSFVLVTVIGWVVYLLYYSRGVRRAAGSLDA